MAAASSGRRLNILLLNQAAFSKLAGAFAGKFVS
jgi:hypothetical protein